MVIDRGCYAGKAIRGWKKGGEGGNGGLGDPFWLVGPIDG